ncbi:hypothetical protein [Hymenobacter sp. 102]|uniref:hypothetical protein n=1 Tax=Hymenobacter sp. 102 TaxID=3403152 RepID=UPI003CF981B7
MQPLLIQHAPDRAHAHTLPGLGQQRVAQLGQRRVRLPPHLGHQPRLRRRVQAARRPAPPGQRRRTSLPTKATLTQKRAATCACRAPGSASACATRWRKSREYACIHMLT